MDLLEKLIDSLHRGKTVPLKHSLLIVSGIDNKNIGNRYLKKFEKIQRNYQDFEKRKYGRSLCEVDKARALSDFLTSPIRYDGNKFLFHEIIDARLSLNPFVSHGNCVGLTCLYNALAEEEKIFTGIIKERDHVLSRVIISEKEYYIENTSKFGFNIHIERPAGRGSNLDLIAEILMSGEYELDENIKIINFAKVISPRSSLVYFNSAIAYLNKGDEHQALKEIDEAVELDPFNPQYYKLRYDLRKRMGDHEGSKRDRKKYKEIIMKQNSSFKNK